MLVGVVLVGVMLPDAVLVEAVLVGAVLVEEVLVVTTGELLSMASTTVPVAVCVVFAAFFCVTRWVTPCVLVPAGDVVTDAMAAVAGVSSSAGAAAAIAGRGAAAYVAACAVCSGAGER